MGNTESTTSISILNETDLGIDQSTYNNVSQSCTQKGSAKNVVNIIGSRGIDLTANQQNELTNMCILNNLLTQTKDASAAIALFNKASAASEAKGGFPAADSKSNVDIRNKMSAKLDQRSYANILQECTSTSNTDNIINIVASTNVKGNISQVNKAFNKCVLDNANTLGVKAESSAEGSTDADASSKATGADPLAFLSGIFGAMAAPWISSASVGVCIVIIIIVSMLSMGGALGGH